MITKALKIFQELYPQPASELNFTNPYELLLCVMLSAQCTDKKVNETTPALFGRYPDFQALAQAKLEEVEAIIRPINYYRTKAKNILATANLIVSQFAGQVPRTLESLTSLPGVGHKTASVVLNELGVEPTFPVDTHVFRVSQRLGLAKAQKREEVEAQLKAKFKPELWRPLHHWLILHGRRVCKAQRPLCKECKLSKICPSYKED